MKDHAQSLASLILNSWYYLKEGEIFGPLAREELVEAVTVGTVDGTTWVLSEDWDDWRLLGFLGAAELGMLFQTSRGAQRSKRVDLRELGVNGTAILHDNTDMIAARPQDISETGLFVETSARTFSVGEKVHVTVRLPEFMKPFSVSCKVVRYNDDPRFPEGYGLAFEERPREIRCLEERLV